MLISYLNGQKLAIDFSQEEKQKKPFALAFNQDLVNPINPGDISNPNIEENSVAVIPISGPLCSWDTMNIHSYLQQANENPNIVSILFLTNSPGGMVFYTDILAKAIKNSPKPTVAAIMNLDASAAMWLTSACNYRIATSEMDRIGSIGIMAVINDNAKLFEKIGIDKKEFYATLSTRKNESFRHYQENINTNPDKAGELITKEIDFTNLVFHKAIEDNLGIPRTSEIYQGATYTAQQAIDLGLIHEINSMEYALNYAYDLGLANKIKSIYSFNK